MKTTLKKKFGRTYKNSTEKWTNSLFSPGEKVLEEGENSLYLGSLAFTLDNDKLKKKNIKMVISVTYHPVVIDADSIKHKTIKTGDQVGSLIGHFENACGWIAEGLKKGSVLVHCDQGSSRSPSVVLAYMMKTQKKSLEQAFVELESIRYCIDPSIKFGEELEKWQNICSRTLGKKK